MIGSPLRGRGLISQSGGIATGSILALAALAVTPRVRLDPESVRISLSPEELMSRFRARLVDHDDVIATSGDVMVRRFSGDAGHFRYATVEIVRFGPTWVTFEHVKGPFAWCQELFDAAPIAGGTTLTHSGGFRLRGGLLTWPIARTIVKRAFEAHVRHHMDALQIDLDATLEPRTDLLRVDAT